MACELHCNECAEGKNERGAWSKWLICIGFLFVENRRDTVLPPTLLPNCQQYEYFKDCVSSRLGWSSKGLNSTAELRA